MLETQEAQNILRACTRHLTHDYPKTPRQVLSELTEITDPELAADHYGQGEIINRFERDIAELLGKEAAVFIPSGTMCQQIALRIWANRRGTQNVAFHPKSHLEIHEEHAYQRLHGLNAILVGSPDRLLTLADLKAIAEPIGVLLPWLLLKPCNPLYRVFRKNGECKLRNMGYNIDQEIITVT